MNISVKITGLIAGMLFATATGLVVFSTFHLNGVKDIAVEKLEGISAGKVEEIRQEAEKYRAEQVEQKKEYLHSQVHTVLSVLEKSYKDATDPAKVSAMYRDTLSNEVNTAIGVLEAIAADKTIADVSEKQQRAKNVLKQLRYGADKKEYFWINDLSPTMIMHPYKPEMDGQAMAEVKDPNGKALFIEMVEVAKAKGEGFVEYAWPKPGADKPQPKLSFVKLFEPWGWIVGSGVYMEDAQEKIKKEALTLVRSLRYGLDNQDYFWINDLTPTMVMHPVKPEMEGQNMADIKDPNGKALFMEMVALAKSSEGDGFVEYSWPKPGADKPQPKLSFVKLFKPWGWVIGTGVYIDDIDRKVAVREKELAEKVKQVTASMQQAIAETVTKIKESIGRAIGQNIGFSVIVFILASLVAWLFTRGAIVRPLAMVMKGLVDGTDQMAGAAGQVSSSGQEIASSASTQAASLEEISASMEEVTSMIKRNADNAHEAKTTVDTASKVVSEVNTQMDRMAAAMSEITTSSHETGKIIKTIDEIAFQTNLLALNAAVEAARAGEAGAGFAVVAGEVRNLAMRAAEAAKNTSSLIDRTIEAVQGGDEIAKATREAFRQSVEATKRTSTLIDEIATASREQATGIEQVNIAVTQLDGLTQKNAANAEESAAAAEELFAQGEELRGFVDDLSTLVGGGSGSGKTAGKELALR